MKKCSRCRVTKESSEFHKNQSKKSGLEDYCKRCYKLWKAEHYVPHKPRPEYSKQVRTQPHGRYLYTRSQAKYRKKEWNLTEAEYTEAISKPCFYCGGPLPVGSSGIDRLDNAKGYVSGNIVPCCFACNSLKGSALTWQEAKIAMNAILNYRRENEETKVAKTDFDVSSRASLDEMAGSL